MGRMPEPTDSSPARCRPRPHLIPNYVQNLQEQCPSGPTRLGSGDLHYIGNEFIILPIVADDVLLIDQRADGLQTLLHVSKNESNKIQYIIHSTKSKTVSAKGPHHPMLLGDDIVPHTKSLTHLGVSRNLKYSNSDRRGELHNCYSCLS